MAHGAAHILFVDDDEAILQSLPLLLELHGYKVTTSASSVQALELFQRNPRAYDIVVTDYVMADMTGDELIRALQQIRPAVPMILCSGSYHDQHENPEQALGIHAFLRKPLIYEDLSQSIQQALSAPQEQEIGVTSD